MYNTDDVPNELTLVTVGFISPVIVPTIDNAAPVDASANMPAVVVVTPVFPNVIDVAVVIPTVKVPAANISNRAVKRAFVYKLLYTSNEVPKLLIRVLLGFTSPVIVPAMVIPTPVVVKDTIPALVVVIPVFPKVIAVDIVSPIIKVPASNAAPVSSRAVKLVFINAVLYINPIPPKLLTFVIVGFIVPVIVPANVILTPVPVSATIPAVVEVAPDLPKVIADALISPINKGPAESVSILVVYIFVVYKLSYNSVADPKLLNPVTVGFTSPVIVPASVNPTPVFVSAKTPAVVVLITGFPNVIAVALLLHIRKVPATIVSILDVKFVVANELLYFNVVVPKVLILVVVGIISPVIEPANVALTPVDVNDTVPSDVINIPDFPIVIPVAVVPPIGNAPAVIVSIIAVRRILVYKLLYCNVDEPKSLAIVFVGIKLPVIDPAIVNPTPADVNANAPPIVVINPAFPNIIPVALVFPISKVPAALVSSRDVLQDPTNKLLYNNAGVPKLLTFVIVGIISPVIEPAIVITTPVSLNSNVPAVVVVTPDLPNTNDVATASPIINPPAGPEAHVSIIGVLRTSVYKLLYNRVELPKLLTKVTVGLISPVTVPTNVIPTPVFVSAKIPAVVVVTSVFPNVIPVAIVSPISKVPAELVSSLALKFTFVVATLYRNKDEPKLLTLFDVGIISPVIVPAIVITSPVPVKDITPAVVVVIPVFPNIIPVAVVAPMLKVPAATVSIRGVRITSVYKLLYNNDDVPNLFASVTVGFISPVTVPTTDIATPVVVKATIPAVVVVTPAFPNISPVALTAPIGNVVAVILSNSVVFVESYTIQPPAIFLFFIHVS